MKMSLAVLFALFCTVGGLFAEPVGYYDTVTNLWYQGGNKTNVLQLAESRLSTNTNDLGGLIVQMGYYADRLMLAAYSNSISRVIAVSSAYTNGSYAVLFPEFRRGLELHLELIPTYTSEELTIDMAKRDLPNKTFMFQIPLKALKDDGVID